MSEDKIAELKQRLKEYAVGANDYDSLTTLEQIADAATSECWHAEDRVRCLQKIEYEARELLEKQQHGN